MKYLNKSFHFLLMGGILVLLSQCKVASVDQKNALPQLPGQFTTLESTSATGSPRWKEYFHDSLLVDLVSEALKNNYDLLQAYQRIEMSRAGVRYAKGLAVPFIGAAGSAGQQRFGKYTMDGVGNYDTNFSQNIEEDQKMARDLPDYALGMQMQWEVDVWGKLRNKKKAAIARYLATEEGKNWLQTNLIADVATTYYELLALNSQLELLIATNELQDEALEIVKLQKEAGNVTELAVNQFEAQMYNFKTLEVQALQQKIEVESRLNMLVGRFPQPLVPKIANFAMDSLHLVAIGTPNDLLTWRPDIRQAELLLKASKADMASARAGLYPSLQVSGFLGYEAFRSTLLLDPGSLAYRFFGGIISPVINRSALNAEVKFSKAAQQEAFLYYQQTVLTAFVEVYNQLYAIENLGNIVDLKSKEVSTLTKATETSSQLFRTGRANYLEVILARKTALQAQMELIDAKKERFRANIDLYRALGGG